VYSAFQCTYLTNPSVKLLPVRERLSSRSTLWRRSYEDLMTVSWCMLLRRRLWSHKSPRRFMRVSVRMLKMVRPYHSFRDLVITLPVLGSLWAIHTRDHRINDPQKCQILVTVPEMLSIMMLSPPLARTWLPRMKRSFFSLLGFQSPQADVFAGLSWTRSTLSGRRMVAQPGNRSCSLLRVRSCK